MLPCSVPLVPVGEEYPICMGVSWFSSTEDLFSALSPFPVFRVQLSYCLILFPLLFLMPEAVSASSS